FLVRVRREDDLVHRRFELRERIANRRHGIALHDEAVRGDPRVSKEREGSVEPSSGHPPPRVLVDDVAPGWLADRSQHSHLEVSRLLPALDRFDELAPRDGLVRDYEQGHQLLPPSVSVAARSPFRTAWRAPGTPYSYGLPTTCGISSKLKIGGGERTDHSGGI